MPKQKSHKGLLKRVRITAKGKIKHKRRGGSHLMSHMNGSQVRSLRSPALVPGSVAKKFRILLGRVTGP